MFSKNILILKSIKNDCVEIINILRNNKAGILNFKLHYKQEIKRK